MQLPQKQPIRFTAKIFLYLVRCSRKTPKLNKNVSWTKRAHPRYENSQCNQAMSSLAMILALNRAGFAGETILRGSFKFPACGKGRDKICLLRNLFESFWISTQNFIYFFTIALFRKPDNYNPNFRVFMRSRCVAERSLTSANFAPFPKRI